MLNFTAFAEALLEKNAIEKDFIEKVMGKK